MIKFSANYILRIDDVCPTMNWELFSMIASVCDEYDIHPILGVIPDNQDEKLLRSRPKEKFWEYIKEKSEKGWIIAQHGYQHMYQLDKKTEFEGLSYQEQYEKIMHGQEILYKNLGFKPIWWMAPAHSFDEITCRVLRDLGFQYVTDGTALYPYTKYGLTWIPQQIWRPQIMPFGTWTICLHTNTMNMHYIRNVTNFMKKHASQFHQVSLVPRKSLLNVPFKMIWHAITYVR